MCLLCCSVCGDFKAIISGALLEFQYHQLHKITKESTRVKRFNCYTIIILSPLHKILWDPIIQQLMNIISI